MRTLCKCTAKFLACLRERRRMFQVRFLLLPSRPQRTNRSRRWNSRMLHLLARDRPTTPRIRGRSLALVRDWLGRSRPRPCALARHPTRRCAAGARPKHLAEVEAPVGVERRRHQMIMDSDFRNRANMVGEAEQTQAREAAATGDRPSGVDYDAELHTHNQILRRTYGI